MNAETERLNKETAMAIVTISDVAKEWLEMRSCLLGAGFTQTVTGSWIPPLGKRPDFEGQALIKASMAVHVAQRELFDAACTYEDRPK